MRLSRKLVMVSAAALMAVSPLAAPVVSSNVAQAATKSSSKVHNTYGKNSKIKPTKTQYAVNQNGKKTSKKIYKNGSYTIWNVKEIKGEVYYSIQTDLKYWIPAVDTKGSVQYKSGSTTVTLTTDGKKVIQTEKSSKTTKKAAKKTASKKTTKSAKKEAAKSSKKATKSSKKEAAKKASTKKSNSKATKKETAKKETVKSSKKASTKKTDSKATKKETAKKETVKSSKKVATKKTDSKATKKETAKKETAKSSKKASTKKSNSKAVKKSSSKTSSKKSTKKAIKPVKITATKKTPVVDKNGKKVKTYMGSKKFTIIGKGVTVNGLGTKKIDGKTYYALQPNHYYVLASDFKTAK